MNIKQLVNSKDLENKAKKDKAIEVFHLIKNKCLTYVIEKTVEYNFESYVGLSNSFIIKEMSEAMGFEGVDYRYLDTFGFGTESELTLQYGVFSYSNEYYCVIRKIAKHSSNEPINKDIVDILQQEIKDMDEKAGFAEIIINTIDYNYLVILLCKYIKSKGFKSTTRSRIYGGGKTEFLDFTISRRKLISIKFDDLNKLPRDYCDPYKVIIAVMIILIMYLVYSFLI